jgi:hypothetical protein
MSIIDALFAGNYVEDSIYKKRISICKQCPHYIRMTKQCSQCGCFLSLKARLGGEECPVGRWGKEKTKSST